MEHRDERLGPADRGWLGAFALQALDASVDAIAFSDLSGTLTYVNQRFLALWGYDDEREVLGRHASSFWTSAAAAEDIRQQLLEDRRWEGELSALTKGGATRAVQLTASLVRDESGAPVGLHASFIDISPQRRAERDLRRFAFLVEGSSEEIYLIDEQGSIVYANPAAAQSLGYSVAELTSMKLWDIDPERGPAGVARGFAARASQALPRHETVHVTKDGRRVPKEVDASLLAVDDQRYVVAFARDISQRRQHEARIAALTRLNALLSQINQAIVRHREPDVMYAEICRVAVEVGGMRAASLVFETEGSGALTLAACAGASARVLSSLAEGPRPGAWTPTREALVTRRLVASRDLADEPATAEWRALAEAAGFRSCIAVPIVVRGRAIGALELYSGSLEPLPDEERALLDELGLDIAFAIEARRTAEERERAEHALRETEAEAARALETNEERLRQIVRLRKIGVLDHDHRSGVIYVSPELRDICQWSRDLEPKMEDFVTLIHPEDRAHVVAHVDRGHAPDGDGSAAYEFRIVRADGSVRWLATRSQTFFEEVDGVRRPLRTVGAVRDITDERHAAEEQERLRTQLAHAQKLESIGRLAGGVAHDFNNMLTVILGHAELLLLELDETSPLRSSIVEMERAAQRSAELTRQLLAFARRQAVSPKILDLRETVEGSLKMLRRLVGDDLGLSWAPSPTLWPVKIDPAQVDQILANLAANARDAIAGHGEIAISTRNFVAHAHFYERHPEAKAREYALLTVRDTGVGMDASTLAHVFEPFFTTKGLGQGTGLGLATVFGIVQQNEGIIEVESEVGRGTKVTIYLPRASETATDPCDPRVAESIPGGTETILLVENESSVLGLKQTILQRLGYHVLAAAGPREALVLLDEPGAHVDLLVTDVIMPEMNGRELWTEARTRSPSLPCLFVSAHPVSILSSRGILDDQVHFLQKPFTTNDFARAVRAALASDR
ncbi:PAS domain S-box protein [Myxococcota bacterium]|nr:PAS domain S-box protein [Myxococcota bacterium]